MEIYEVLKRDHEELKSLLSDLIQLKENDDYRFVLIEEIRNALVSHSRAEEQVFYNTLRAINADKSLVRHGYQEHLEAEALLRSLQVMDKLDLHWKAVAEKLKDTVEHHLENEEMDIFSEAKMALSSDEAVSIAEAYEKLKPQVAEEGFIKNSLHMVVNLMPPRLADSLRNLGEKR